MRRAALCLPLRDRRVLLPVKRSGQHAGTRTAYGGKIEVGESVKAALVREVEEESGLEVKEEHLWFSAAVTTYLKGVPQFRIYVFTTWTWVGTPKDTREMWGARWFPFHQLPLKKMFPGDAEWLPHVLQGKRFRARVHLDKTGPQRGVIVYHNTPRYHPYDGPAE